VSHVGVGAGMRHEQTVPAPGESSGVPEAIPAERGPLRIEGFDLARGLAFLGMVYVNFRLAIAPEGSGPAWLAWLVSRLDGRAAATFVTLAGAGLSLLSRKARRSGDREALGAVRRRLRRRGAFLFVVGLAFWTIWPADILHYYGVYLAIGALLLDAPDRRLLALAAVLIITYPVLLVFGPDYSTGWDWTTLSYDGFWTPRGFLRNLLYNGFHPLIPWLAFLLFGMWLGRRDLRRAEARRPLVLGGLGVATAAEALSFLLRMATTPSLGSEDALAVFGTEPMPPMPLYMLAAGGMATAVIGLCVMAAEKFPEARWRPPLVATGQLALTLYLAHVLVGLAPLELLGLPGGHGSLTFSIVWATAFGAGAVLFASLWRRRFARGPLEMLMRRVAGG
jgi:uncharacterized protein